MLKIQQQLAGFSAAHHAGITAFLHAGITAKKDKAHLLYAMVVFRFSATSAWSSLTRTARAA
jgi:hypothetical protein